ncbi:hypothetical protein [Candidatus Cytomitobacter primus]|uniref:Uncharacterized protein n=2 Tax=Candidatus Cytomitobacter primus TaxID=2066024 RepID=A0A5C0UEH1_9PROT|nr:hypothetical protein [Candidatus Cytomitobacter primus]QEK38448.1 hypothetical protein FZC34_00750 [Candidatus Cytomitobacter primus]
MFVFCDEIFKENGNYNIENIKTLSYSSFALLFLCIIPMCGIPGFEITYMYGKVHLISSILVKSTNILLFFKLFKQMHQTQFTKLQIKHIIFFPCIIFLLPSTITIIKICYLILYILIALLLHAILQQYRLCKNFNFTNIIGYIRKIPAPQSMQNVKKTIYIYLLLFGILNIAIFNPQFLYNLLAHFKFNYNEMHFLFLLLFGCFLLLYKGLPSKLAGLLLISIYMTNEYIKFGGVDIAVTNIIVDIIITYLIIKSKINFNVNKQSIPGSIFSFLHSMLLAICLISCFKIPSKIVQYPANTTVNDIVVHYRVLDTLGETLTLLVIAYAIQLISNRKKHH